MKTILIVLLLALTFGCKKDQPHEDICTDIETPGDYFPGYPNTWWKYVDQNNETVVYSISSSYEKSDDKCRPVFLNLNKSISNMGLIHHFYTGQGKTGSIVSPIYSMIVDSVLTCPVSFSTLQEQQGFTSIESVRYKRVTKKLDTTLTVNGTIYLHVMEVYEFDKYNPDHRYFDYFAKDIGLIKRDSLNANDTTDRIQLLELKDYFIGN